jgi:fumarylacetoacetase
MSPDDREAMTQYTDETHDPKLKSWIASANDPDGEFPIQNLPFGVFRRKDREESARIGVAIGDSILDVNGAVEAGLLDDAGPYACCALCATTLNDLLSLGRDSWTRARRAIGRLLRSDEAALRDSGDLRLTLVVPQPDADLLMPVAIGDYTDFYASIHHATNVGSMFRPDNPLMPNYKHLPVGYHGRASSVVISGTPIRRPMGQTKADEVDAPTFGPCRLLDYELEMGVFTGPGNKLGRRIPMAEAGAHLFGMCIVNDWSARDIQKWEYQPLGPFNAKDFATTISPWVVTMDALAPYRVEGPHRGADDPPLLDYLKPAGNFSLDITVEVYLASQQMRERGLELHRISRGNFRDMYWTIAQMLAHHSSTGCNFRPGDLIASGTVSGPEESSRGCLLEMTWRGQNPIQLPDGTERKFLADGDEVIIRAFCEREGFARIGFGECRGVVLPTE